MWLDVSDLDESQHPTRNRLIQLFQRQEVRTAAAPQIRQDGLVLVQERGGILGQREYLTGFLDVLGLLVFDRVDRTDDAILRNAQVLADLRRVLLLAFTESRELQESCTTNSCFKHDSLHNLDFLPDQHLFHQDHLMSTQTAHVRTF